jgi:hypothetical protein
VVGQAGIADAILIVLAAKLITSLTAVSLAGVATNTRVKGGGAYFLISRSLGVEFGDAIGVVFFLAQAISVAMYVIGFTEAFARDEVSPAIRLEPRVLLRGLLEDYNVVHDESARPGVTEHLLQIPHELTDRRAPVFDHVVVSCRRRFARCLLILVHSAQDVDLEA